MCPAEMFSAVSDSGNGTGLEAVGLQTREVYRLQVYVS